MCSGGPYQRTGAVIARVAQGCCLSTCTGKTPSSWHLWSGAELGRVHQGESCRPLLCSGASDPVNQKLGVFCSMSELLAACEAGPQQDGAAGRQIPCMLMDKCFLTCFSEPV